MYATQTNLKIQVNVAKLCCCNELQCRKLLTWNLLVRLYFRDSTVSIQTIGVMLSYRVDMTNHFNWNIIYVGVLVASVTTFLTAVKLLNMARNSIGCSDYTASRLLEYSHHKAHCSRKFWTFIKHEYDAF